MDVLVRSMRPPYQPSWIDKITGEKQHGRFPGTYPPNYNEGTHLICGKGPTRLQVVPN